VLIRQLVVAGEANHSSRWERHDDRKRL